MVPPLFICVCRRAWNAMTADWRSVAVMASTSSMGALLQMWQVANRRRVHALLQRPPQPEVQRCQVRATRGSLDVTSERDEFPNLSEVTKPLGHMFIKL